MYEGVSKIFELSRHDVTSGIRNILPYFHNITYFYTNGNSLGYFRRQNSMFIRDRSVTEVMGDCQQWCNTLC
jgi:hypothetical protein